MDSYIRLIYTSTMTTSSNNIDTLNDIIDKSKTNNKTNCIGGKLIWIQDESSIFQIIEGCSKHINTLFDIIKTDTRHYNIVVLSITDITRSDVIYNSWISKIIISVSINDSTIQDYKLSSIIGTGGTSTVVLGENIHTKKKYAIKMINKRRMTDKNINRIITERNILSSSKHPFIQSLKSSLQDACHIYFITSFAGRGDLYTCVKQNNITIDTALFYIYEIISGLRYLHAQDIIHNDMKLENVLINLDGHIALTDFGVSFNSNNGTMSKQTNMDNSSRDGAGFGIRVVGTPFYFAPEVINQMLKTKASDIWAVGIMLCEMLTERLPWDGMSKKEMFKLILVFKFETVIKTIDPIIVSLLSVLCEYDYKKRFTCDNIIAKIIELGVIQNIDDIENKRINPPFIPPETLPYSTTIIDFERIRTPSNNNEDEFLNNFNLDDNHPDKIISPYKSIQSSHPLMTINRNFE